MAGDERTQTRLDELQRDINALRQEINNLTLLAARALRQDARKLTELRLKVQSLAIRLEMLEVTKPAYSNPGSLERRISDTGNLLVRQRRRWLQKIAKMLATHFDMNELRQDILFPFGAESKVNGDNITNLAQATVAWFERRNMIAGLVNECQHLRPAVQWPLTQAEVDSV